MKELNQKVTVLSLHLFCASKHWNNLLVNTIHPYLKSIQKEGWSELFFFIRYWEDGPHIRLRMRCKPNDSELLMEKLYRELNGITTYTVRPEVIPYQPEYHRYGGIYGMNISEKYFHGCSTTVLDILSSPVWDDDSLLSTALYLHLSLAFSIGCSLKEAEAFFEFCYTGYRKLIHTRLQTLAVDLDTVFKKSYDEQGNALREFVQEQWQNLNDGYYEEPWQAVWIENNRNFHAEFTNLQFQEKLTFPQRTNFFFDISSLEYHPLWTIYYSLIHMTNNRLGILNRDEAWISYALKESILIKERIR